VIRSAFAEADVVLCLHVPPTWKEQAGLRTLPLVQSPPVYALIGRTVAYVPGSHHLCDQS